MGYVLSGTRAVGRIGSAAGLALASGSAADQLNKTACAAGEALLHGSNLGRLALHRQARCATASTSRNRDSESFRAQTAKSTNGLRSRTGQCGPIAAAAAQYRTSVSSSVSGCVLMPQIAIFAIWQTTLCESRIAKYCYAKKDHKPSLAERLIASRRMRETAELSKSLANQRVVIKVGDGSQIKACSH